MHPTPTRRDILKTMAVGAAGATLSSLFTGCADFSTAASTRKKNILFFTKSGDFPHSVVTRANGEPLAFAERTFKDFAEKAGYGVTVSKDGSLFTPAQLTQFDAFVFYTTGVLDGPPGTKYKSDQTPAMPPGGKDALLNAIASGKGFLGIHCGDDTFHSPGYAPTEKTAYFAPKTPVESVDPYIRMIGGEFNSHGAQQPATIRVADKNFPGLENLSEFTMTEEWYSPFNLAPDLHVILVQDTTTMHGAPPAAGRPAPTPQELAARQPEWQYRRDPYPETWARRHGQGRVFYTSMGHRDDVWIGEIFQKVVLAGLAWTSGNVRADVPPNLAQACPALYKTLA